MKKLLIFTFYLSTIILVQSQVYYGVKGAIQFTNVSEIHGESETRNFGVSAGGFAQIPFNRYNENLFIRMEILYSQQGEYNQKEKYFQDYINIPLMIKYYLFDTIPLDTYGDSELFVEIGPQLGYLIHETNKEKDLQKYAKASQIDISLGAGIGLSFYKKYELNIRYNYGLSDAYKEYPKMNNTSNLSFSLSYSL